MDDREIQAAIAAVHGALLNGFPLGDDDKHRLRVAAQRTDALGQRAKKAAEKWDTSHPDRILPPKPVKNPYETKDS